MKTWLCSRASSSILHILCFFRIVQSEKKNLMNCFIREKNVSLELFYAQLFVSWLRLQSPTSASFLFVSALLCSARNILLWRWLLNFVGAPSTDDIFSIGLKHHYQKESERFFFCTIVLFAWGEKDKARADRVMRKSGHQSLVVLDGNAYRCTGKTHPEKTQQIHRENYLWHNMRNTLRPWGRLQNKTSLYSNTFWLNEQNF